MNSPAAAIAPPPVAYKSVRIEPLSSVRAPRVSKSYPGGNFSDTGGRKAAQHSRRSADAAPVPIHGAGDVVARRSLDFYDAVGRVIAIKGHA